MIVTLDRTYLEYGTAGVLSFFGHRYYTCERPWLGNKPFVSCMPAGEHKVKPYHSIKFPDVWEVVGVPGRTKILFHVGNKPVDVQGCIAVGLHRGDQKSLWVGASKLAIDSMREVASGKHFTLVVRPFSTVNHASVDG